MSTPGQSSGTYSFALTNAEVVAEAFDRIQVRPPALTRHHWISARRSLNLELQDWTLRGVDLWKVALGTVNLVANQATYTAGAGSTNINPQIVSMLDTYFTTVNGAGSGINLDRLMSPMNRTEYAALPQKLQPGTPTLYWFQRLITPQVTLWQPPEAGAPTYVMSYYYLYRVQDAAAAGGETPDVPYRALDALCAGMAARLAEKFNPAVEDKMVAKAAQAWARFATNDQEWGPMEISPNTSSYWQM